MHDLHVGEIDRPVACRYLSANACNFIHFNTPSSGKSRVRGDVVQVYSRSPELIGLLSCRRETARRFVSLNNFAKSLEVTQDHSKWHCCVNVYESLLVFQRRYVWISYPFLRYSASKRDLETGGRGRSRSLKMAPFDRSYTTFYWSAIVSI